ncbi:hypothetical protein [Shewanella frigidimarina]|uniref:hypothetical protein n=1 Tax=Shewanella frigidimarina TaxID=56812 RepID=UPI003D7B5D50
MSAIANFKKRREAAKAKQHSSNQDAASTPAPENEALVLLAALLGCEQSKAIDKAKYFVKYFVETGREPALKIAFLTDEELKRAFPMVSVDPSNGDEKTVITQVTTDDDGNITAITELSDSVNSATDSVNDAADSVTDAAEKIDQSASNIDDSASDLAYSADSIANAASDIKEATAELKKPSAVPKSSHSKKAAEPKKNSKK